MTARAWGPLLCGLLLACPDLVGPPEPGPGPLPADDDDDASGWRSALYPADWTPAFTDAEGRFLHDVSYAGYRNGEALPLDRGVPVVSVLDFGADRTGASDATAAIQAAIDSVVEPADVLLPAGDYRCDGVLRVTTPGLVLKGDGIGATRLFFTGADGMTDRGHVTFAGDVQWGGEWLLTADGASRSTHVPVDSRDFDVGDEVRVGWVISDEFVADHGMEGTWQAFNGTWRTFFRRTVVGVDATGVVLDVPLRYPALVRDGASVRGEYGYLRDVGIQDLSVSTVGHRAAALAVDRTHAIRFDGVADGFIARVESYDSGRGEAERHLLSGGVIVVNSKRVTVADSAMGHAQNRGAGGNGYLFEVSRSSEILFRDLVGIAGRHNFIQNWDFGTSGTVWLRTTSRDGFAASVDDEQFGIPGFSEYHHSLAMANLVDDSVTDDGWAAVNRHGWSSGAGHSATQNVFWNVRGTGVVRSFQFGWGYVIGTGADIEVQWDSEQWAALGFGDGTAPDDFVEGQAIAESLVPQSLYEDQLARRRERSAPRR